MGPKRHEYTHYRKNLEMDRKNVSTILDKFNQYGSVEVDLRSTHNGKTPMLTKSKLRKVEKIFLENELIA